MKKTFRTIIVFLLIACMVCLCACSNNTDNGKQPDNGQTQGNNENNNQSQGNNENNNQGQNNSQGGNQSQGNNENNGQKQEFDRLSAIKPVASPSRTKLPAANGEEFSLVHIDTDSYPECAELFLDYAYRALKELGIDANVTAIYKVSAGLAAQNFSFDPVLIETDDASVNENQVFMIPYEEYSYKMFYAYYGAFRDSDVSGKDYRGYTQKRYETAVAAIDKSLGFDKEGYMKMFNTGKLKDLSINLVSEDFEKLYEETAHRYFKVMLVSWYDSVNENYIEEDGVWYQEITADGISSIADLKKYLKETFTDNIAGEILDMTNERFQNPYMEKDGKLYCVTIGMGGPEDLESVEPKAVLISEDGNTAFLIIECTRVTRDYDDWDNVTDRRYYGYSYVYEKIDGVWKCASYTDIIYGMF